MDQKHKWSQDEMDFFIHLYKKHECLWNNKSDSYSSKELRESAYADISAKMSEHKNLYITVGEIKNKMYKIRSAYHQLRNRSKYSSICPSERVGKWYKDIEYIVTSSKYHRKSNLDAKLFTKIKPQASKALALSSKQSDNYQEDYEWEMELITNETSTQIKSVKFQSRIEIMNVLKKLYMEKVAPTYHIMLDILTKIIRNDDKCLTSDVEHFKYEMTKLGYHYKETIDGMKIIVENAEQRFERYLYLTKIRKLRAKQNKPIVYLDERIINQQLKYEKIYSTKESLPPESSVFFLAISKDGVLSNLFSNQATEEDFNKWVTDIVLAELKTSSVIIMDSGPIHGTMEDTCPVTRYSSIKEMLKWLNANNIPCSPKISRPELFELIRMNKRETKEYKIDRIIKSHGHEVLRLPCSFPDLNMCEILWKVISDGNTANILPTHSNIHASLLMLENKLIEVILPSISTKKWSELEKILTMKENDVYEIDTALENVLETYVFMCKYMYLFMQ